MKHVIAAIVFSLGFLFAAAGGAHAQSVAQAYSFVPGAAPVPVASPPPPEWFAQPAPQRPPETPATAAFSPLPVQAFSPPAALPVLPVQALNAPAALPPLPVHPFTAPVTVPAPQPVLTAPWRETGTAANVTGGHEALSARGQQRNGPFVSWSSSAFMAMVASDSADATTDFSERQLRAGWDMPTLFLGLAISEYEFERSYEGPSAECYGGEVGREWRAAGSVVRLSAAASAAYCRGTGFDDVRLSVPMSLSFGPGEKLAGRTWAKAITAGIIVQPALFVSSPNGITIPVLFTIGSHILPFGAE